MSRSCPSRGLLYKVQQMNMLKLAKKQKKHQSKQKRKQILLQQKIAPRGSNR
jgi:hypothetical protein